MISLVAATLLQRKYYMVAKVDNLQTKTNALREPPLGMILQSATGEELDALLLPSVLDRAFKGEL